MSARYAASAANLSLPGDWAITAIIRRRGADDVQAKFDVPISQNATASSSSSSSAATSTKASSDSMWDWPFHGARSAGAIAALVVGVFAALGVGVWQYRELREAQ